MNAPSLCFFTIVARNFLAEAIILADSLREHHPEAQFAVYILDDVDGSFAPQAAAHGFSVVQASDLAIENYEHFVFQYTVTEASTGVKPFVMRYLLDSGAERLVYLDPDMLCCRPFTEVLAALENASIVLTPHSLSPIMDNSFPDDAMFLSSGVYNLGFIAVRADENARKMLLWWSERLEQWCFDMQEAGLFVDQKWADLIPAFFDGVCILRSPAYNIAYWNFHERVLQRRDDGHLYVLPSGEPVALLHFSGINLSRPGEITKYGHKSPFDLFHRADKKKLTLTDRPDLAPLFADYFQRLKAAGHEEFLRTPYAYAAYANGDRITLLERALFARASALQRGKSAFATGAGSFWQRCRHAGIRPSPSRPSSGGGDASAPGIFGSVIRRLLRRIVRLAGPDRYERFAKYMRQQMLLQNQDFLLK
jgi:hypothetical protein